MATVTPYATSDLIALAALKTLWSYLPTIYDSGNDFNGAPIQADFPVAPTAFAGPDSVIPIDSEYYMRTQKSDEMRYPVPCVIADIGQATEIDRMDCDFYMASVPVGLWVFQGIDTEAHGTQAAREVMRLQARAGAHAAQWVCCEYLKTIATGLDATDRYQLGFATKADLPTVDQAYDVTIEGRDLTIAIGYASVNVTQFHDDPVSGA